MRNLQARHINEAGDKGATLVHVSSGRIAEVEPVAFDVVRWKRLQIDVSACGEIDDVATAIDAALVEAVDRSEGRTLVVRLEIIGRALLHRALKADPSRLDAEIERASEVAGDVWIEQVQVLTTDALEEHPTNVDALGGLLRAVETFRGEPGARELLRQTVGALPNKLTTPLRREIGLESIDDEILDYILDDARDILLNNLRS